LRQTLIATEKFHKDGKLKNVHYVLKDRPFLVEVQLIPVLLLR